MGSSRSVVCWVAGAGAASDELDEVAQGVVLRAGGGGAPRALKKRFEAAPEVGVDEKVSSVLGHPERGHGEDVGVVGATQLQEGQPGNGEGLD
ncbi:MAG: hypothetical protein M3R66_06460, partial [Actinomycetota bacterium]|nr:hypothetical protein [Actinomycetota bacterium]